MSEEVKPVTNAWAVVVTGVCSNEADVVPFRVSASKRCPVPIYINESKEKCEKMVNRIRSRISKVLAYGDDDCLTSMPLMGVKPILLKVKQKAEGEATGPGGGADSTKSGRRRRGN